MESAGCSGGAAVSGSSSSTPAVVAIPCAACKILRRRCGERCGLAPYFPPTDPLKFMIAHRVFGASNITKLLQDLPEPQRPDAVSSIVFEANARLRDPVYGSAGAIFQLQRQVNEVQAQLAKAQAELVNLQCQQANLLGHPCMEMGQTAQYSLPPLSTLPSPELMVAAGSPSQSYYPSCFVDESNLASVWDPLWA